MEEIINEIIKDLGADKPIKGILLKSQIVASKLNNNSFSEWITYEQNGYPDAKNLPEYRIIGAVIKADIHVPYMGYVNNQTVPSGIFEHDVINDCMGHVRVVQSLSEIENICKSHENGMLSFTMPAIAYSEVNKYIRGEVQRLWQEFPASSLSHIVDVFKSKLLDFFLQLNKKIKGGIDFSQITPIENKKIISQIMNNTYNINAAIANMGDGTVNTSAVTASNFQITPSGDVQQQMNDTIAKIEEILNNHKCPDAYEALETLKEEVTKPTWSKKAIKLAFNALKGISTGVFANQITPYVTQGLALLV